MSKKKTLNLDTFNEILIKAMKDTSPEEMLKLYVVEINIAYSHKLYEMEKLVDALNRNQPYKEIRELLTRINNIDASCNELTNKIEALEKEYPEITQTAECTILFNKGSDETDDGSKEENNNTEEGK